MSTLAEATGLERLTDWAELGVILSNALDGVQLHIHRLAWP